MTTSAKKKRTVTNKTKARKSPRKWSARVMQTSDALDLQSDIFKSKDPNKIARSLKTLSRVQQKKERYIISIGDVHAQFLHQSRWKKPVGASKKYIGKIENQIAGSIWSARNEKAVTPTFG